ncbi:MAG: hypothetical protein JNK64_14390 [Myxococcales bacterium]|nr:hypothetical protein [Myxococcales bacterium]
MRREPAVPRFVIHALDTISDERDIQRSLERGLVLFAIGGDRLQLHVDEMIPQPQTAACTEPTPIPGPVCGDEARLAYCKDSCAADALCPGHDQWACELDCRACRTDDNYCPADPE